MKIEKPELLKEWMVVSLKPICDAEPAKLARYVLALVRKDRSGTSEQLRACLLLQLEVFLQEHTAGFVDLLLKILYSGEYLGSDGRAVNRSSATARRIVHLPDNISSPVLRRPPRDAHNTFLEDGEISEMGVNRYRSRSPNRKGLTVPVLEDSDSTGGGIDSPGLADLRHRLSGTGLGRSHHCNAGEPRASHGSGCALDGGTPELVVSVSTPGLTPSSPPDSGPVADAPGVEPYIGDVLDLTTADAASDPDSGNTNTEAQVVAGDRSSLSDDTPCPVGPASLASHLSLLVSGVPPDTNHIMPLNQHFSQFGRVTNVQVAYGGDPEAALVTFSSAEEAAAALAAGSHQLANQPVTVHRHTPLDHTQVVLAPGGRLTRTVTTGALRERAESGAVVQRPDVAEIKRSQQLLAATVSLHSKDKERQQAARQLSAELRRRESELLARQLSQQRALLARLEAPALRPHERAALLQTLKRLQEGTQRTRQTLADTLKKSAGKVARSYRTAGTACRPATGRTGANSHTRQERQEVRRRRELELLDLELELHQRKLAGAETHQLQRRLQLLRASGQLRSHRLTNRHGGRPGTKPTSIDRRPTTLLVSGTGQMTTEFVLQHLQGFGAVTRCVPAGDGASLLVTFASRGQAEAARAGAGSVGSCLLSLSWAPVTASSPPTVSEVGSHSQALGCDDPAVEAGADAALLEDPLSDSDLLAEVMCESDDGLLADSEDETDAVPAQNGERDWRR